MKFKVGDTVRHIRTKRIYTIERAGTILNENIYWMKECAAWIEEIKLKKYTPSRTGKYRNKKGQFISTGQKVHEVSMDFINKRLKEQANEYGFKPDYKLYKKIEKLPRIEYVKWGYALTDKINEIIDRLNSL